MTEKKKMTEKKNFSNDWEEDCFRYWGYLLTGNGSHWCPDWDFLPIDDTLAEFEVCTCPR
jgi:hypothetical protein